MSLPRFYVSDVDLAHDFWIHDQRLLRRLKEFKTGQQIVLFDGLEHDRLYKIDELDDDEAHVVHVTDLARKTPKRNVYLLWSVLEKDKNDRVLRKGTELGVSHFLPLIADGSEKTGFNHERAEKIVVEAAEQCGRSDIPTVREPMHVATAIDQLSEKVTLFMCEQDGEDVLDKELDHLGVLIGPEDGWSDAEKALFKEKSIKHLNLHDSALRAETAAIAAAKLVQ